MACLDRLIPIFPLPNCVVLPGAVQGLHIFEPRYRQMVADELQREESDRLIAMAFLREGYEPHYCTRQAPIHPTLCVGQIVRSQLIKDGKYNVLLVGRWRAEIVDESHERSYRLGRLRPVATVNDLKPSEETALRQQLAQALMQLPDSLHKSAEEIIGRENDLERVVDLMTFHLLAPRAAPAKQMILAEPRVGFRTKMLITLIQRQFHRDTPLKPSADWPPSCNEN